MNRYYFEDEGCPFYVEANSLVEAEKIIAQFDHIVKPVFLGEGKTGEDALTSLRK